MEQPVSVHLFSTDEVWNTHQASLVVVSKLLGASGLGNFDEGVPNFFDIEGICSNVRHNETNQCRNLHTHPRLHKWDEENIFKLLFDSLFEVVLGAFKLHTGELNWTFGFHSVFLFRNERAKDL